jgi:hypothetical protein
MKGWISLGITVGIMLFFGIMFRAIFVTFVDNYELGYEYDKVDGTITELPRTGYFIRNPITVAIHTIDLRPMQVRIEANNRVLNAKLVKFRKEGLFQFIGLHGRGDYDVSSQSVSSSTFADIMKCYAYENYGNTNSDSIIESKYKFIKIISNTNTANLTVAP